MRYFPYGQLEVEHLSNRDKRLGEAIERIGKIHRETHPDPFKALIKSVMAQQISGKAAKTVWERLINRVGCITPQTLAELDANAIQACGMSHRKAGYIKGIALAALSKEVDFECLGELEDAAIIRKLSSLHGVGVWTAEMLLIFSLHRPNVLSFRDMAIHRGMTRLYELETITKEQFEVFRKRYSPYGSVASLYLWELSA